MRWSLLFISTTVAVAGHQVLWAQVVTTQEPPPAQSQSTSQPEPPDLSTIPLAAPLPPATPGEKAAIESDMPQTRHGNVFSASGNVVVTFRDHILRADVVTYDQSSGDVTMLGHVQVAGGENDEFIQATSGTYNLHTQTGTFYDVSGSVGLGNDARNGYVTPNPFLFTGRKVVKTGAQNYEVYDGSVTSCVLPHPDWQLFGKHFQMDAKQARASNSTFKLLGIPVLFLPYVTHPVDANERQSGILIPTLGYSTASANTGSKGLTIGEQAYLVLGRSADLTVGSIYYSLRGWSENATVRYRGVGDDFISGHFSALQDRGFNQIVAIPNAQGIPVNTDIYTNQGGEDVTASFRRQFTTNVRAVGDAEYLSNYIFREAFTESFNQAVSSDILSTVYLTRQKNGYSLDGRFDRYQGQKIAPTYLTMGQEVKIFHAPSIDFTALDHHIAGTPLIWSLMSSAAGLKRVQPNFTSSGIIERLDVQPELSLPLAFAGWHTMTSVALRDTFYSRSRQIPYSASKKDPYPPNAAPIEITDPLNRNSIELNIDIRPPAIERTFTVPKNLQWALGSEVRHTLEPEITYRNVHGISNFLSILRFDDDDLASDTDELEYGLTQHLYFRPRVKPVKARAPRPGCPAKPVTVVAHPAAGQTTGLTQAMVDADALQDDSQEVQESQRDSNDANGIPNISANAPDLPTRTHRHADPCAQAPATVPQQEWFSWRVAQKVFFAQNFGGAVINTRRNIFDTTLDFSGIAFLTEARSMSPVISRMRMRTSSHSDVEWDFDYDPINGGFTSQNVFFDAHEERVFGGVSYAYLNAPGRFRTAEINSVTSVVTGLTTSSTSNFSQLRVLIGYGSPTKPGISAAASAGIDLNASDPNSSSGVAQYVTLQSNYNWNCCGLSVEYRKYDLGTVRNEGAYRFNFTLANIGTAGNLRRTDALF